MRSGLCTFLASRSWPCLSVWLGFMTWADLVLRPAGSVPQWTGSKCASLGGWVVPQEVPLCLEGSSVRVYCSGPLGPLGWEGAWGRWPGQGRDACLGFENARR